MQSLQFWATHGVANEVDMIIYPAIDLKNGRCVRLTKGDFNAITVFNENPLKQAQTFQDDGFKWLHVVDLDGALEGRPINKEVIEQIVKGTKLKVQVGGGIRNMDVIDEWLSAGVERVILGTAAVKQPEMVRVAARQYPNRIVVAIDARDGMVATEGWEKSSNISAIELAQMFEDYGVAAILHTDIERDGTLQGPNFEYTARMADSVNIPVILSGGVGSPDDLEALKRAEYSKIAGVIVGKAFYEGIINQKWAAGLLF